MGNFIYNIMQAIGYGHPIHPILVHLVIGPVVAAFLIGLASMIFRRPAWLITSRHLNVFAFLFWFITVPMGIIDWQHFYNGQVMTAIIWKLILAGVLFLVLLATILVNRRLPNDSKIPVIFYGVSTLLVVGLGYFGGSLVYGS